MNPATRRLFLLFAASLGLGISATLTGCATYTHISHESSTTVRGTDMQIYGTINQSYTRSRSSR